MQKTEKVCQNCGYIHVGLCAANTTDFIWKNGGNVVFLTGSWNQWQTSIKLNKQNENPYYFTCTMSLQAGTYQYKFIVDGKWTYDQSSPSAEDGFGSFNNVIEVVPRLVVYDETEESEEDERILKQIEGNQNKTQEQMNIDNWDYGGRLVKITTTLEAPDIKIKGSWDNWQADQKMIRQFNNYKNNYENITKLKLKPGRYEFKFMCNGIFMHDPNQKCIRNQYGTYNNIIYVEQPSSSLVSYSNAMLNSMSKIKQPELDCTRLVWKSLQFQHVSWEKMRGQIQGHSMNRVGDYIYIYGGYRGSYLDTMWEMNINTYEVDIVDTKGSAPEERAYHQINNFGNKLLMYGGLNNERILRDYYVYNTSTRSWDAADLRGIKPSKREKNTLSILGKKALILFGGYYCSEDFEAEFHYNDLYCLNLQNLTWTELRPESVLPEPRFSHSANIYKHRMFVFGGMQKIMASPAKNFNDVWMIDLEPVETELKWENLTPFIKGQPPAPRHGHISVLVRKKILIFGGRGENKQLYNDTFVFDTKNREWIKPQIEGEPPRPRFYHAACLTDKEIVIFGGNLTLGQTGIKQKNKSVYILKFEEDKKDQGNKKVKNGFREGESDEDEYGEEQKNN
ncbi:kelch motif protein (macronuclear) [Tetrahymena thermophila SB210]|uniref:Kelch motif protein n=1 Tax=Tetrahymena thermophila (strain SB210) TaxID=312017 RepID=I7MLM5_TETTS|nr:kelch motif protein [Tetrahymena thermophila SB210]EAS02707.3 kelch motif protein [Tetrahymena thermophila SB210]|eukprot:XP_001022952.3 kelch motif protein [Tetrahymena thermophila SB210]